MVQKDPGFYFASVEELRNKWIRFANRSNWTPTKHFFICVARFEDKFIINNKKKGLLKWDMKPPLSIYITEESTILPPPPSVFSSAATTITTKRDIQDDELNEFLNEDLQKH